jgi:hypothetical protein
MKSEGWCAVTFSIHLIPSLLCDQKGRTIDDVSLPKKVGVSAPN